MTFFKQFVAVVVTLAAVIAVAEEPREAENVFTRDVQPILTAHCVECHGPKKQENGLRLDFGAGILRGGDNGPAVVRGKAAESLLVQAMNGTSDSVSRMPLNKPPLSETQIAVIREWIDSGAIVPADSVALTTKSSHWAFQKPVRPRLPNVVESAWPSGPIDSFVMARLEQEKLIHSDTAERPTLIRRAALDLIGLPPSPDEVEAFIADKSPDAYERVIDRLLASPHYGERWGRHWLDLARYADSNGYTRDFGRQIWKYREWVIEAINANMPFDRFTIEQIAGDMLPDASEQQLVATGFHRNTLINEEGGTDAEQFRVEAVVDRVNTTGAVWLGLTVGCARCHSHKYDPISQVEYYQLFALLNNCEEPTIEVPTRLQRESDELARRADIRTKVAKLEEVVEQQRPEFEQQQRKWEATVTPEQRSRLPGPVQVAYDMKFEARDEKNKKLVEDYFRQSEFAREALPVLQKIFELREGEPKIPTTMIVRERAEPRETFVHRRGDFLDRGADVIGKVPAVLPPLEVGDDKATRLDFARWLVSSDQPLTPRVTINRDWQKFFGRGLVETEDDFGVQGTLPSHPELLDWLASEFIGWVVPTTADVVGTAHPTTAWDVKRMHRMIVTSNTYRQSSTIRTDLAARDPQNRLLARQSRLRLDAEIVRDIALSAAGLLTTTIGGPSVFPPQPEGVFDFTQDPKPWKAAAGGDRYRRGMYTHFWRSSPYPMLLTFDAPGGNVTCTRRLRSNTPLQSLTVANDEAFYECAAGLAQRVLAEEPANDLRRAELAFQLCVSRQPSPAECQLLVHLIREECAASPSESKASWTRICRVLLNLDETITRE